jgi:hypothetical protein
MKPSPFLDNASKGLKNRLDIAEGFLKEAESELEEYKKSGDEVKLRLVCEKAWGAIAQGLMYATGKDVTKHKSFEKLVGELKSEEINEAFVAGDKLHSAGFYHGVLGFDTVKDSLELIKQAITVIRNKRKSM